MPKHNIFKTAFAKIYPLYIQKAERKNRTKAEVDQIILWLTGYDQAGLQQQIDSGNDLETFFAQAPRINPQVPLIVDVAGVSLLPHSVSTNAAVTRVRVFIKVVIIVIFLFLKWLLRLMSYQAFIRCQERSGKVYRSVKVLLTIKGDIKA
jgi:hypothetical protein